MVMVIWILNFKLFVLPKTILKIHHKNFNNLQPKTFQKFLQNQTESMQANIVISVLLKAQITLSNISFQNESIYIKNDIFIVRMWPIKIFISYFFFNDFFLSSLNI